MTKKTLFGNFVGFITHAASELRATSEALTVIVDALPLQHADKARVRDLIASLDNGATSIGEFLATNPTEPATVKISKADIKAAIGDFLNSDEGRAMFDMNAGLAAYFDSDHGRAALSGATLTNSQSSENAQDVADASGDNRDPAERA